MDISINYWGVLLAGLSSMAIGAAYYAHYVIGSTHCSIYSGALYVYGTRVLS